MVGGASKHVTCCVLCDVGSHTGYYAEVCVHLYVTVSAMKRFDALHCALYKEFVLPKRVPTEVTSH